MCVIFMCKFRNLFFLIKAEFQGIRIFDQVLGRVKCHRVPALAIQAIVARIYDYLRSQSPDLKCRSSGSNSFYASGYSTRVKLTASVKRSRYFPLWSAQKNVATQSLVCSLASNCYSSGLLKWYDELGAGGLRWQRLTPLPPPPVFPLAQASLKLIHD